jgi:hypothetical protein
VQVEELNEVIDFVLRQDFIDCNVVFIFVLLVRENEVL